MKTSLAGNSHPSPLFTLPPVHETVTEPPQAYESVLTEHGISPEEDTQYYRFLLKLSLDPDPDWWVKYEREKARVAAAVSLKSAYPRSAGSSSLSASSYASSSNGTDPFLR